LVAVQARIHEYEIAHHQADVFDAHWPQISDTLKPVIERARQITEAEYQDALAVKSSAERFFAEFFQDYDAILAPSAAGEAPPFAQTPQAIRFSVHCGHWQGCLVSRCRFWWEKPDCRSVCN
jgi:Asp-tRNA(Asn)/Glu-tRNA(Gln) amidotransferase A subunit family amidase